MLCAYKSLNIYFWQYGQNLILNDQNNTIITSPDPKTINKVVLFMILTILVYSTTKNRILRNLDLATTMGGWVEVRERKRGFPFGFLKRSSQI